MRLIRCVYFPCVELVRASNSLEILCFESAQQRRSAGGVATTTTLFSQCTRWHLAQSACMHACVVLMPYISAAVSCLMPCFMQFLLQAISNYNTKPVPIDCPDTAFESCFDGISLSEALSQTNWDCLVYDLVYWGQTRLVDIGIDRLGEGGLRLIAHGYTTPHPLATYPPHVAAQARFTQNSLGPPSVTPAATLSVAACTCAKERVYHETATTIV